MFTQHTFKRPVVLCCAIGALVLLLGAGCPQPAPLNQAVPLEPLWANIVTDSYLIVGGPVTASLNTNRDADSLEYRWSVTSPATIVGDDDAMTVTYSSPTAASVVLTVIVTDPATGSSVTAATSIGFLAEESESVQPPVLEVSPDRTVAVGETVLLLGTVTGPRVSEYMTFWRQTSGPAQTITPDYAGSTLAITVVGTTPGTAVFEFIVVTYDNQVVTKSVNVEVTPATGG